MLSTLGSAAENPAPAPSALLLSDLHFDPFTETALAPALADAKAEDWDAVLQRGKETRFPDFTEDTNRNLWTSALTRISQNGPYAYAVVTGDLLAHLFQKKFKACGLEGRIAYSDFVQKTLKYMDLKLSGALAPAPIYWVLGNNDSDRGDYGIEPGGPLLKFLSNQWACVADAADASAFRAGGYYESALPQNGGRLIALNSIFWSRRFAAPAGVDPSAPGDAELAWLSERLDVAEKTGTPVTLAMHIPPGLNAFGHVCGLPSESFWTPKSQESFLKIVRAHARILRVAWAGHTHFDDVRLVDAGGPRPFAVHLIPSIGPNHGNDPAFQILALNPEGVPTDYTTWTLRDLTATAGAAPAWGKEYRFSDAYGAVCTPEGMQKAALEIAQGGDAEARFAAYYACETPSKAALQSGAWAPYVCAQTCLTPEDFEACACKAATSK
jgi:hypothetical protein